MQLSDITEPISTSYDSVVSSADHLLTVGCQQLEPWVDHLPLFLQPYLRPRPPSADPIYWYITVSLTIVAAIGAGLFTMSRYSPRSFQSPRASQDFAADYSYVSPEDVHSAPTASRSRRTKGEGFVTYRIKDREYKVSFPYSIFEQGTVSVGDVRKEIGWAHRIADERLIRLKRDGVLMDDDTMLCHHLEIPVHDGDMEVDSDLIVYAYIVTHPERIQNHSKWWRRDEHQQKTPLHSPRASTRSIHANDDYADERSSGSRQKVPRRKPSVSKRRRRPSGPAESAPNLGRSSPQDSTEDSAPSSSSYEYHRTPESSYRHARYHPDGSTTSTSSRYRGYSSSENPDRRRSSAAPRQRPAFSPTEASYRHREVFDSDKLHPDDAKSPTSHAPIPRAPSSTGTKTPQTMFEKFRENERKFDDEVMPLVTMFVESPPPDRKEFDKEKARLNELIDRTCIANDSMEFAEGEAGREEKRALTRRALAAGKQVENQGLKASK